ncbi:MAG TPA: OmpA family protein [Myxococcota bacterium]|jgi:chemotaxis protein MotB
MRLWSYALLMTLVAAGGTALSWRLFSDRTRLDAAYMACSEELLPAQVRAQRSGERALTCEATLRDTTTRVHANDLAFVEMESDLSATREELTALRAQRVEADKRMAAIANIQARFAKMIDTGELKVTARRGSLVVELPAEVLFRSGSADLSEKGQLSVLEVGFILKQLPDRRFLVVGHTDNIPLKSAGFADNWELSTARALTVTHVLVKAGMKSETLLAAGAGEHDPLRGNARPADRQRNRRIEIQLLPAITELPPLPATLSEAPAEEVAA